MFTEHIEEVLVLANKTEECLPWSSPRIPRGSSYYQRAKPVIIFNFPCVLVWTFIRNSFKSVQIEASLHAKTMEAEDVTKEVTDILQSSTKGMTALGRDRYLTLGDVCHLEIWFLFRALCFSTLLPLKSKCFLFAPTASQHDFWL